MDKENVSTLEERRVWFDAGVAKGATHMIVVSDTFDWTDFPIYVMPGEDVRKVEKRKSEEGMNKIMEVFDLRIERDPQFDCQGFVFNYNDDEGNKVETIEGRFRKTVDAALCAIAEKKLRGTA